MTLSDFPALCRGAEMPASWGKISFSGISCDSRTVQRGDLFAAVKGNQTDGATFARSACEKGASAILSSEPIGGVSVPVVVLPHLREAIAILADATAGHPSRALSLFGITGTNGKTSTAWMLSAFLTAGGRNPGLITTVETRDGKRVASSSRTTPDACTLQKLLARMVRNGCDSAVMEVSSHALDQFRTGATKFSGAVFTHVTQDHLDYHHTMSAYFETKKRLFSQLAETSPGAPAVCLPQAPYGKEMEAFLRTLPLHVVTCGLETTESDFSAERITLRPDGASFLLRTPEEKADVQIHLPGRYNIANLLCAVSMASMTGVPFPVLCGALANFRPRWGRLERVETPLPGTVYVDYAHTDDALSNVLKTLRETTAGRLLVLFGCGGDRDRTKRPLMGAACARDADFLILTSDNPRSEDPAAILQEIQAGIPAGTEMAVESDRRVAIRHALSFLREGDTLLVAGKGHETTQEIAGVFYPFDDRQVIREESTALFQANQEG